jgi:hypothetical protein
MKLFYVFSQLKLRKAQGGGKIAIISEYHETMNHGER